MSKRNRAATPLKSEFIAIKCTPQLKARIEEIASDAGITLSEWVSGLCELHAGMAADDLETVDQAIAHQRERRELLQREIDEAVRETAAKLAELASKRETAILSIAQAKRELSVLVKAANEIHEQNVRAQAAFGAMTVDAIVADMRSSKITA